MIQPKDIILTVTKRIPLQFYGFLYKDTILLIKKEKYLYLSILFPILLGIIYVLALTSATNINVKVCDYDNTDITRQAVEELREFTITYSTSQDCQDEMIKAVQQNTYLFGIIIDEGFTQSLQDLQSTHIDVYYDNSNPSIATLAQWKIDDALTPFKDNIVREFAQELKEKSGTAQTQTTQALQLIDTAPLSIAQKQIIIAPVKQAEEDLTRLASIDPEFIVSPITTQRKGAYQEYSIVEIGIAPLFAVLSMFIILMLCSTGVMHDRKTGLIKRIKASSSSMITYISAKITYFTFITIIQALLIIGLFILFGASYSISPILLLKALIYIAIINTLIGIIIGYISDNEGVAVLFSLIISLPLLLLSGMFYPVQVMPKIIQFTVSILPLERQIEMLQTALLYGGAIAFPVSLVIILGIPLALLIRKS
ncbi:MAG: ABC transporter permease [Candidatus Woesearchaeota archaeon]